MMRRDVGIAPYKVRINLEQIGSAGGQSLL